MAHGNIYPPERDRRRARQLLPAGQPRRRCASWRCCGSPTGSTRRSRTTASATASTGPWETRERVVVALTGAAGGDHLDPPRGAHGPARARASSSGARRARRTGSPAASAERARPAARARRGARRRRTARSSAPTSPQALVAAARAENATQIVLGASRRSRWAELDARLGDQPGHPRVRRRIDVHVICRRATPATTGAAAAPRAGARRRCRAAGASLGLAARRGRRCRCSRAVLAAPARRPRPAERAAALPRCSSSPSPPSAASGRRWPPRSPAFLLVNWYFTPPLYTFTIARGREPPRARRLPRRRGHGERVRRRSPPGARPRAARARAEARGARAARRERRPVPDAPRDASGASFGLDGRGRSCTGTATTGASRRPPARAAPATGGAAVEVELDDDHVLALAGRAATGAGRAAVLDAFAAQLARARSSSRSSQAEAAERRRRSQRANELRTALLVRGVARPAHAAGRDQGVGRRACAQRRRRLDAGATRDELPRDDRRGDRPAQRLVGNLLDMSRLQTGALDVAATPVGLEEVVAAALAQPRRRAPRSSTSTSPRRSRACVADPRCSSGRSPTSSTTPSAARRRTRRCGSRPASVGDARRPPRRRPRARASRGRARAGLRAVPAARRQRRTARASGSAWPSRRASSRRWAATIELEDTPGGGLDDGRPPAGGDA